jgi:hypothetical protein
VMSQSIGSLAANLKINRWANFTSPLFTSP